MQHPQDQQPPAPSSWWQNLDSSLKQISFDSSQSIGNDLQSDMLDCVPNPQSQFHPEDDAFNLSYNTVPDTNSFAHTLSSPENPFSRHSHEGALSPIKDDQHCAGGRVPADSARTAALAPAQPKTLSNGDLQPTADTRQQRRREQNRIAQRAFRQRKEKHIKELEHKLAALEASQSNTGYDNAQLQRDFKGFAVDNTTVRSLSSSSSPTNHSPPVPLTGSGHVGVDVDSPTGVTSPQGIENSDPHDSMGRNMPDSESLLYGREIWDFVVGHRLFREGLVDMVTLRQQLQGLRRTDANVPVATEATLTDYMEKSLRRY